ncbi:MAG: metallophosphoesterase [Bosea sp.]|jgi:3',5'-cyclic AMP phosphodiesterase CpdA|nr:metallophosphoesterase [Bosea sp. (in: a-proteobacteria)]
MLAHLSDPHLNPLPRLRATDLMGKRATGYVNWLRSRRFVHDMELLDRIVADMLAQQPDHVACTGDVTHIGLPGEFPTAIRFLDRLGPRERVSFVPGNHDAYVASSLGPLSREMAPWTRSEADGHGFPWMKVRGHVALIGLSSAVPTGPLMAWGKVGPVQLEKAERLLAEAGRGGLRRVVLIHHPPHVGGAGRGRELKDADSFEAMIERAGADLVIHGHNHKTSLSWIRSGRQLSPVVGVASCSMGLRSHGEKAGWHLFRVPEGDEPITLQRRGLLPNGGVGLIEERPLVKA